MPAVVLTGPSSKNFVKLLRLRDRDEGPPSAPKLTPPERQHRLTAVQRDDLVAAYLAGESTTALAKRFGIHRSNVSLTLKHAGVLKPLAKLTETQIEQAMTLRAGGLFYRQIAELLGVDTETVRRAVLKRLASGGPDRSEAGADPGQSV